MTIGGSSSLSVFGLWSLATGSYSYPWGTISASLCDGGRTAAFSARFTAQAHCKAVRGCLWLPE